VKEGGELMLSRNGLYQLDTQRQRMKDIKI
jgi:hypothetical protein